MGQTDVREAKRVGGAVLISSGGAAARRACHLCRDVEDGIGVLWAFANQRHDAELHAPVEEDLQRNRAQL